MDDSPTVERRMEVFATSRHLMAKRFGLPVEEVARIEREGLDQGWPPLD
jgi:hypothetical protein